MAYIFPNSTIILYDNVPLGAKVSHNEKHWISTYDNNTWEPGVFGWEVMP